MHVDPRARIWQLSLGEQQRVEIVKALYRDANILILDEPTAVLTPQEAEVLFTTLRAMAEMGSTVIFISHKLHEVKAVADRVTVLRGGRAIATVAIDDATPRSLAALMVGRELAEGDRDAKPGRRRRRSPETSRLCADDDRWPSGAERCLADRAPARSWPSPASQGTASASWRERSRAFARRPPATCPSRAACCATGIRAPRSRQRRVRARGRLGTRSRAES
jgi:ABC-type glutathione transport system ATPase component